MNQTEIRIRELEMAVEANRTLLLMETEKAKRAAQQIIKIGYELGGVDFDIFLKEHRLDDLCPEDLANMIIGIAKANRTFRETGEEKTPDVHHRLEEKDRLLDIQSKRAETAEGSIRILQKQIEALTIDQTNLRQENLRLSTNLKTLETTDPTLDHTAWFDVWEKQKGFARDSEILVLIGKKGWARVSKIIQDGSLIMHVSTKTMQRGIQALLDAGLLNRQKGLPSIGRPTDLVFLTDKGRWIYSHIAGDVPIPSEYDGLLKAHKSNLQSILVLKAGDQFNRMGFVVDTHPTKIKISDNRFFEPDLIISKGSDTYYLEVETGIGDNREELTQKWENAHVVGGGSICLVTRDKATMSNISSNIVRWAREHGKPVHLFATNLEALKIKATSDSPWVIDKER